MSQIRTPDFITLCVPAEFYDEKVMDVLADEAQGRIKEFSQQNLVMSSAYKRPKLQGPMHLH